MRKLLNSRFLIFKIETLKNVKTKKQNKKILNKRKLIKFWLVEIFQIRTIYEVHIMNLRLLGLENLW